MPKKIEKPQRTPRKKPKISLLQIMFLIAAAGLFVIVAQQHGGLSFS